MKIEIVVVRVRIECVRITLETSDARSPSGILPRILSLAAAPLKAVTFAFARPAGKEVRREAV